MWNLRESMETEAELHKKRCPLLNAGVYCQSSWSWKYSVLGGDTVVVVETGEGWNVSCWQRPRLVFSFDDKENDLPFNITVDLPSAAFPYFWGQVNKSHYHYHFSSWPSPSHRIILPCQYPQLTASFFPWLPVSFLSLLCTGRPQDTGSIPHPLLFMHIIPSSLSTVLFRHQSPELHYILKAVR